MTGSGNKPTAVLTMIALQLSCRISVKKRAKRCRMGVEVAASTWSWDMAERTVDSRARAQSVTAALWERSEGVDDDDDDDDDVAAVDDDDAGAPAGAAAAAAADAAATA